LPFSLDAVCLSAPAIDRAFAYGRRVRQRVCGGPLADAARRRGVRALCRWDDLLLRLVYAPIAHADDLHLYYNVTSLLVKGVLLEQRLGSDVFAAFVAFGVLAGSALYYGLATLLAAIAPALAAGCAVGFSGVLFAMKVALDASAPGVARVRGRVGALELTTRPMLLYLGARFL